jgi:hypothetical protein
LSIAHARELKEFAPLLIQTLTTLESGTQKPDNQGARRRQ